MIALSFTLFGQQNLLLLHDNTGTKDLVVRTGKRVKVKTLDNVKFRGEIIEIKDSSFVLGRNGFTEIPLNQVQYFYVRSSNGWKTAGGIFLGYSAVTMSVALISGIQAGIKANTSIQPNDSPIIGLVVLGGISLPALFTGTYFALFHKKKYDVRLRYDLSVVKSK